MLVFIAIHMQPYGCIPCHKSTQTRLTDALTAAMRAPDAPSCDVPTPTHRTWAR